MSTWIYFTLLAALMQAIRTAGQKQLSEHLSAMATTGVRYIYALPFAVIYLFFLLYVYQEPMPQITPLFLQYASIASVSQIIGTACLVAAFRYRNFAVATSFAKTEAILVAILGALLFSISLSLWGWFSVAIGVIGVIIVSKVKFTVYDVFNNPGAGYGLASGLGLAVTTLLIRESSLALNTNLMISAAFTLCFMVVVQSLISFIYLLIKDKKQLMAMLVYWRLCLFVGVTSVIGSIGWFTAASYQNAAYVKALGQIEFFFTLVLTYRIFKESITLKEYVGMGLIIASVLILLILA